MRKFAVVFLVAALFPLSAAPDVSVPGKMRAWFYAEGFVTPHPTIPDAICVATVGHPSGLVELHCADRYVDIREKPKPPAPPKPDRSAL